MFFLMSSGRGRQMDAYVDNLFDSVQDRGPSVSDFLLDSVFPDNKPLYMVIRQVSSIKSNTLQCFIL